MPSFEDSFTCPSPCHPKKLLVQPRRAVARLHKKFLLGDILFSAQALDPPLALGDNINQQRLPRCPVLFLSWA
jgi:hypothetical protein